MKILPDPQESQSENNSRADARKLVRGFSSIEAVADEVSISL